jgi:hypothetical protein
MNLKLARDVVTDKGLDDGENYKGMGGARILTAISSASARGMGLEMWSPYKTPTFWVALSRDAYSVRRRSEMDLAPALTSLVAVRSLQELLERRIAVMLERVTYPIPGIFFNVSKARSRSLACLFNTASYTRGVMSASGQIFGTASWYAYRHVRFPEGKNLSGLRCRVQYHVAGPLVKRQIVSRIRDIP